MTEVYVRFRNDRIKVKLQDILYIRADGRYSEIITVNQNYFCCKTLKEHSENLESQNFFRCHQSYLVNLRHLKKVDDSGMWLGQKITLPVARKNKHLLQDILKNQFQNR